MHLASFIAPGSMTGAARGAPAACPSEETHPGMQAAHADRQIPRMRRNRKASHLEASFLPPSIYAACRDRPLASANSLIISLLLAGMSSGLRLVIKPRSTTPLRRPSSTPAVLRSVLSEGHDVMRRPRAAPASITVQGPWQIDATGLPASKNTLAKATAFTSTGSSSPQSVNFQPRTRVSLGDTTLVSAPASSRTLRGSVSSICSKPSVTRMAIFSLESFLGHVVVLCSAVCLAVRDDAHPPLPYLARWHIASIFAAEH